MSDPRRRELDDRLEQAIDALNAEQPPVVFEDDDPELVSLVDTLRVVRRLREPAEPDEALVERLVEAVATGAGTGEGVILPNGRAELARAPVDIRGRSRSRALLAQLAAVIRVVGICVLAGMLAGAVAGGIGGRIAMRASGYLYEREHPGQVAITESSGQFVGEITLDGTLDLMIEMALFYGISGGLLYLLILPWLPRSRRWRAAAFAGLLVVVAGASIISSDNRDFERLGSPVLNVIMFAALIAGFGLLFVPLAGWIERVSAPPASAGMRRIAPAGWWLATMGAGVAGLLALLGIVLAILVGALAEIAAGITGADPLAFGLGLVIVVATAGVLAARAHVALRAHGIIAPLPRASVRWIPLAALALLVLLAAVRLLASIISIVGG
jgi:hypothetical protein